MVKKIFVRPRRSVGRVIQVLNVNGGQAEFSLVDLSKDLTIVRMMFRGTFSSEAVSGAVQALDYEIWRKSKSTGATLPTIDISGGIAYADDEDLMIKEKLTIMRETTSSTSTILHEWDSKGQRKFTSAEHMRMRLSGGAALILAGVLTIFFKDV